MDSFTLPKLLQCILEWSNHRSKFPRRWTGSQLKASLNYFSNVKVDPSFTLRVYGGLGLDKGCCHWHRLSVKMVDGVLQELGELFKVPRLQQLSHLDDTLVQNELVAGFINFLLQLLHLADSDTLPMPSIMENHVTKELKFLVTILGDTPFQATEHQQVQRILAEFEQVANGAGILVHSLIFGPYLCKSLRDEAIEGLLDHIHRLQVSTIRFLNMLPNIMIFPKANNTVDSLFIVHSLKDDVEDPINWDDTWLVKVKDQIEILHQWLSLSLSLLKGFNVRQFIEVAELKELMLQIQGVAYESEYLIRTDVPLWYLAIRLNHVINNIKFIGTRLQEMKAKNDIRIIEEDFGAKLSIKIEKDGSEEIIVGFEDKHTDILDQLVGGREQLQLISIVGMPGIGKTTLAKKLYNDPLVIYHFHVRAWCVISQMYQKKIVLANTLIGLSNGIDKSKILEMDEDSLTQHIYQSLKGKRYLMVLDDVWDFDVWKDLQRIFPTDGSGSRILFTNRNKDVAPSNTIVYNLSFLTDDQCWKLLKNKVFHNQHCPPYLEEIGKEIAAKCYGLPLVVVVIAGVLSAINMEKSMWKNVRENLNSYIFSDQNNSVMQILELSYKHLPQHLKPCFLYFGIFQEDEHIIVKKLKWLWIAEGFIHDEEQNGAESVAEEYLMELIDRNLVIITQKRSNGGAKICVIHDLLRDLCLKWLKEKIF